MANLWSARKSACHTRKVAYAGQRRLTGARSHSTSALGKNGHRPFVAGCVRSRTAASEQRNSWNPCVPDRQLCGSCYDRFGSGRDSRSRLAALPRRCELEVSVRPAAAARCIHKAATWSTAAPWNLPDGQFLQLGPSRPSSPPIDSSAVRSRADADPSPDL